MLMKVCVFLFLVMEFFGNCFVLAGHKKSFDDIAYLSLSTFNAYEQLKALSSSLDLKSYIDTTFAHYEIARNKKIEKQLLAYDHDVLLIQDIFGWTPLHHVLIFRADDKKMCSRLFFKILSHGVASYVVTHGSKTNFMLQDVLARDCRENTSDFFDRPDPFYFSVGDFIHYYGKPIFSLALRWLQQIARLEDYKRRTMLDFAQYRNMDEVIYFLKSIEDARGYEDLNPMARELIGFSVDCLFRRSRPFSAL